MMKGIIESFVLLGQNNINYKSQVVFVLSLILARDLPLNCFNLVHERVSIISISLLKKLVLNGS